jgi:hypothetical protein
MRKAMFVTICGTSLLFLALVIFLMVHGSYNCDSLVVRASSDESVAIVSTDRVIWLNKEYPESPPTVGLHSTPFLSTQETQIFVEYLTPQLNTFGFFRPTGQMLFETAIVGISLWWPFGIAVLVNGILLYRAVKRFRRHRKNLCDVCGYDLRATPTRCPECGTVPGGVI